MNPLDTYNDAHKDATGKLKTYLDFLIARTMASRSATSWRLR